MGTAIAHSPEWRDKFLSYKDLKKLVRRISAAQPSSKAEAEFIYLLNTEIGKFNAFFMEQEEEFVIRQRVRPANRWQIFRGRVHNGDDKDQEGRCESPWGNGPHFQAGERMREDNGGLVSRSYTETNRAKWQEGCCAVTGAEYFQEHSRCPADHARVEKRKLNPRPVLTASIELA